MQTSALLRLSLATLACLAVLIGLGVWQLQRLEWKEGLIARIETRTERAPMDLEQAIGLAREGRNLSYTPVRVEGRFHHTKERYLYALSDEGKPGWHVITPLETVDGDVVLVDRFERRDDVPPGLAFVRQGVEVALLSVVEAALDAHGLSLIHISAPTRL